MVLLHQRTGRAGQGNCSAESKTNLHAQLQSDALFDRCDPGLHPLICSVLAELPAPREDHGVARRLGGPFIHQLVCDSFPTVHREDGPETLASGRRHLAHGCELNQGQGRLELPPPRFRKSG